MRYVFVCAYSVADFGYACSTIDNSSTLAGTYVFGISEIKTVDREGEAKKIRRIQIAWILLSALFVSSWLVAGGAVRREKTYGLGICVNHS